MAAMPNQDVIEIRPCRDPSHSESTTSNRVDVKWKDKKVMEVLLLIEPSNEATDEDTDEATAEDTAEDTDELTAATANLTLEPNAEPVAIWLTKSTPQSISVPLPTAAVHIRAYGLEVWGRRKNYKVVSSFDAEWDGQEKIVISLQKHRKSRSILKSCSGTTSFSFKMDKSRSFVKKLPITEKSLWCLILCQQQEQRDKEISFQEWILLKGQQLLSLPDKNLESVLPSRRDLGIKILALRQQAGCQFHLVSSASDVLHKHMYLNKADLEQLKAMALEHRSSLDLKFEKTTKVVPLRRFFRNKTLAYFDDIENNRGGLMEVYKKDNNGDPESSINGNIKGLFFSAFLVNYNNKLPESSPFGERRLLISAHILFTEDSNLYFADFYCADIGPNYIHYVTLVLTKQGSPTDDFCRKRLLPLDPKKNPFLTRVPAQNPDQTGFSNSSAANEATVYVTLTYGLLVEVLYTENVDIEGLQSRKAARFADCESDGTSKPDGNPKNKKCRKCNLARIT